MRTGSRPSSSATAMVFVMMSATSTATAMAASSRTRFAVAGAASEAASGWSLTLSIMPCSRHECPCRLPRTTSPGDRACRPPGSAPPPRARTCDVVTTSSWSRSRSRVSGVGVKASSSRTTRLTVGAPRQPQLLEVDPLQPGADGHADLQEVGAQLVERRGVDLDLPRLARPRHPEQPGDPRQGGALQQREHDHQHEHDVDEGGRAGRAFGERDEGEHDGHRAAQARPGEERLLAPRHPERQGGRDHGERPGGQQQHGARDQGGHDGVHQPRRRRVQPEQHEQADLGEPARALGERAHAAAVGQVGVAEDERGHVRREEPGGVRELARGEAEQADGDRGERVEAGGGQRGAAQRPRAAEAEQRADQPRPRPARRRPGRA